MQTDVPDAAEDIQPASSDGHPMRRCLATGDRRPVSELIRFVVGPDNSVVPDVVGNLPGRGLWLSARRDVVNTASDKGLFARAAKCKVSVPAGLADELEYQIVRRCVDVLGLARRAGQVVTGFEKVSQWLKAGRGGLLITAADCGADGQNKLQGLGSGLYRFTVLDRGELGRAFGRDQVVHAALQSGRLADRLVEEQGRLVGFRVDRPQSVPLETTPGNGPKA